MKKILFLTSRNVVDEAGEATGVGAATLIFRRATEIYKKFGVKTYIIPINGRVTTSNTGFTGTKFVYKESSIKQTIYKFMENEKPNIIIYSGDKSYFYESYIRRLANDLSLDITSYIDLHGALEEGIEYNTGIKWFKSFISYNIRKSLFRKVANKMDGVFVVSDEMIYHYSKLISKDALLFDNTLKVRCGVNDAISDRKKLEWRKEIRKKWNINENTIVFVYSGYRASWQCIDEIVENFVEINSRTKNVFFVFLTQSDKKFDETLEMYFPDKNYFVGLVPKSDLFKYLCACDVGMLIRRDDYTNRVAFPNKFSDYLNAGLLLTISKSLSEPIRLLEKYKVPHILLGPCEEFPEVFDIIQERQDDLSNFYAKTNILIEEELLYATQIIKQREKFSAFLNN